VNFGIVIDNMRAQGYNGAASMSGIHRGVHARIRERSSRNSIRLPKIDKFEQELCGSDIVRDKLDG